ncbi:MAG: alpha-L-fucosidase [Fimbriimonas sp.]
MSVGPARERTRNVREFEELQYGMFIHFGLSTFTGIEIPREPGLASEYQPTDLDVDQWIRVAAEAGMRYAVLTTKHCYGHCLWPSAVTDHVVTHDVVRGFADACARYGLKAGFYYLLGWDAQHQPKMSPVEYEAFCRAQVAELLTGYGPVREMWFDIAWDMGPDTSRVLPRLYELVKSLQPDCLVMFTQSNNVMHGVADPFALADATYFYEKTGARTRCWPSDITNAERRAPGRRHEPLMSVEGSVYYLPMEVCDTLTPNWFWVEGDPVRPLSELVELWERSVGCGANLLLDVPPDRSGQIPDEFVEPLMELRAAVGIYGAWTRAQAIHRLQFTPCNWGHARLDVHSRRA